MAVDRKGAFLQKSVHKIINVLVKNNQANYTLLVGSEICIIGGYNDWSTFL